MAKKKYEEQEGVWRTIGGRRVFIRTGQSLSDAMKESGKFKSKNKKETYGNSQMLKFDKPEQKNLKAYSDYLKGQDNIQKLKDGNIVTVGGKENFTPTSFKYENGEVYYKNAHITGDTWAKHPEGIENLSKHFNRMEKEGFTIETKEQQLNDTFEVGDLKRKALETLPKEHIDSHASDLYLKKTKESTELLNRMKNKDSGLLSTVRDQQTGEEWYEVPFANMEDDYKEKHSYKVDTTKLEGKYETLPERTKEEKISDERYANAKAMYKLTGDEKYKKVYQEEIEKATERIRQKVEANKTGNDYLPKESKITTQGTSNRKEVSDNIQAHILSYYDNPVDFMEQMDAMDYLPTRWRAGEELAKGGSYLIYNGDISDYLNTLGINPKGKTFSEDKSFNMYTSLVGRESERLYKRMEKLYEQYKKEHKGTDVSLDDFRKWFK